MTNDPFVILYGQIVITRPTVLSCPTCGADREHKVRGQLGDPLSITCKNGHPVPVPDDVNHTDLFMNIASQPGVNLVDPE